MSIHFATSYVDVSNSTQPIQKTFNNLKVTPQFDRTVRVAVDLAVNIFTD